MAPVQFEFAFLPKQGTSAYEKRRARVPFPLSLSIVLEVLEEKKGCMYSRLSLGLSGISSRAEHHTIYGIRGHLCHRMTCLKYIYSTVWVGVRPSTAHYSTTYYILQLMTLPSSTSFAAHHFEVRVCHEGWPPGLYMWLTLVVGAPRLVQESLHRTIHPICSSRSSRHKHSKNTLRLASPVHRTARFWCESKPDHICGARLHGGRGVRTYRRHKRSSDAPKLTTSNTFGLSSNACKQLPVRASRHSD